MSIRNDSTSALVVVILAFTSLFLSRAIAEEKKEKIEPKLTIYDDERLKGKSVVVRKKIADLREVKFSDKSESIAWELPPGKAFIVYDEKNFKLPILILVGKGEVLDIGKEQRNALHSISSVNLVSLGKGRRPSGVSKDVPKLGEEEQDDGKSSNESMKDDPDNSEEEAKPTKDAQNGAAIKPKSDPLPKVDLDELLAADKRDLRPAEDFKDQIVDVAAGGPWFLNAKKGDFVEYSKGKSSYQRQEIIEKDGDIAIVANIVQTAQTKSETRVRMKLAKDQRADFQKKNADFEKTFNSAKKEGKTKDKAGKTTSASQFETLTVKDQKLDCVINKVGQGKVWRSLDVPFEGIVKETFPNGRETVLLDFGRGE